MGREDQRKKGQRTRGIVGGEDKRKKGHRGPEWVQKTRGTGAQRTTGAVGAKRETMGRKEMGREDKRNKEHRGSEEKWVLNA